MFHHFHQDGSCFNESQGSIDAGVLEKIIDVIGLNNFVSPGDVFSNGEISKDKWLLTFDDGLKCQAEIALPILEKYGIKAFWFIHTMPLESERDYVESYRYFRGEKYPEVDRFYEDFFQYLSLKGSPRLVKACSMNCDLALNYLSEYKFYSDADRVYRYIRDVICDRREFYKIMDSFIESRGFDLQKTDVELFMSEEDILNLKKLGHEVGLHSHTHYTRMACETDAFQEKEYSKNYDLLSSLLGRKVRSVSYPCGSYNDFTLDLMKDLGIEIGFRSNDVEIKGEVGKLELPRIDHIEYIKEIGVE